jgi:hypothetical protein
LGPEKRRQSERPFPIAGTGLPDITGGEIRIGNTGAGDISKAVIIVIPSRFPVLLDASDTPPLGLIAEGADFQRFALPAIPGLDCGSPAEIENNEVYRFRSGITGLVRQSIPLFEYLNPLGRGIGGLAVCEGKAPDSSRRAGLDLGLPPYSGKENRKRR